MKYDRAKHDVSGWEPIGIYEQYLVNGGDINTRHCDQEFYGLRIIPRQQCLVPGMLFWAWQQMLWDPKKEYTWGIGAERFRWSGECLESSLGEYWKPRHLGEGDFRATDWRPVEAQAKEGTNEWALAQPEGTCFWAESHMKKYGYFKVVGGQIKCFAVLDGHCIGDANYPDDPKPFTPCLHHGKPAEPVVGSKFWAQIMTKEFGKCVTRHGTVYRWNKKRSLDEVWNRDHWYNGTVCTSTCLDDPSDSYRSGWSICDDPSTPKPAPTAPPIDVDAIREKARELLRLTGGDA